MLTTRELISTLYNALDNKLKKHRGNWEQNDPTAKDYIKNRPFYETDPIETVVIDNLSSNDSQDSWPKCTFKPGQEYKVIWNNQEYNCMCQSDGRYNVLGDPNELPFYIDDDGGNGLYITSYDEPWTLTIITVACKLYKIDKKYLPNVADVAYSGSYYDLYDAPHDVIRYDTAQNLTSKQQQRVRNNIGAADVTSTNGMLKYTAQTLTDAQKEQARNNIGVNITFDTTPTTGSTNPVTSDGIKSYVDEAKVQSDWNIKDENDLAFIKSKPFYHNIEYTQVSFLSMSNVASATSFNETTSLFYGTKNKTAPSGISDGQQYKIIL